MNGVCPWELVLTSCTNAGCFFSHIWLCDPMNCSLPVFSVHGILQARILEWVAMPSSRGSSQSRDGSFVSCSSRILRQILYHWATWGDRGRGGGGVVLNILQWSRQACTMKNVLSRMPIYLPQRNSIHSRMGLILHLFYSLRKTFLSSFMSGLGLESVDLILKTQPPIHFKGPQWVFHSFSPTLYFCWFSFSPLGIW